MKDKLQEAVVRLLIAFVAVVLLAHPAGAQDACLPWECQPALPERFTVRIVFIPGRDYPLPPEERASLEAQVGAALAWWDARVSTTFVLSDETATAEAWPPPEGYAAPEGEIVIYLVGSEGVMALALPPDRAIYIETGVPSGPWFESTVAHEIGHAAFNLPDLYREPGSCPPGEADIMCAALTALTAYQRGEIGCRSMRLLGMPCRVLHFPQVYR